MRRTSGYVLLPTLLVVAILYMLVGQLWLSTERYEKVVEEMHYTPQLQQLMYTLPNTLQANLNKTLQQGIEDIRCKVPISSGFTDKEVGMLYLASAYLYVIDKYVPKDSYGNQFFDINYMPKVSCDYTFNVPGSHYKGKVRTLFTVNKTARTDSTANEHKEMANLSDYKKIQKAFVEIREAVSMHGEAAYTVEGVKKAIQVLEEELHDKKPWMLYTLGEVQKEDRAQYYRAKTYTFLELVVKIDQVGKRVVVTEVAYQKEERNP